MKRKIWNNVTKLALNEALRIGRLSLKVEDHDRTPFEFKILDHLAKAVIADHFSGREIAFAVIVDAEPNDHKEAWRLTDDPLIDGGWMTKKYKNCHVCAARVRGWMEIENGPFVCSSTLQRFELIRRRGWGQDIADMNVVANGYRVV